MSSFARYKPPTKVNVLKEQLPERLKRTIDVTRKLSHGTQEYMFNRANDKPEIELSLYRQKYPEHWKRNLMTLSRVKLSPGMFVTNKENDIDQNFKVKEALVYNIAEQVFSPTNPETQQLAYCTTRMGVFRMPRIIVEKDDLDNIVKSSVEGWQNIFYIPWNNGDSARAVLDEFGGSYKNTVLAIGAGAGDSFHAGNTYSVFNLQEWLEEDFDTLLGANKGGFLMPEFGGIVKFKKDQAVKRAKMQKEIAEFKKQKGK